MPLTSLFVFPVKKIEVRERNKKWKITWSYGVINFCMILKWWIRNKTNLSYKNLEKVNRYWENENKGAQEPEANFRSFKKKKEDWQKLILEQLPTSLRRNLFSSFHLFYLKV